MSDSYLKESDIREAKNQDTDTRLMKLMKKKNKQESLLIIN